MTATEIDDADDDDLYSPIPDDVFDVLIGRSKHDAQHIAAARWVLVPLLDQDGRQVLTREGEWVVLSIKESAALFGVDERAVRRVVGDLRRAYARYRLEHDLVESYGPNTEAQWQANRALQAETVKTTSQADSKKRGSYFRRAKGRSTE